MERRRLCSMKKLLSGLLGLLPLIGSVGYSQTTSITSSGLNTRVAVGSIDPAGRQNYDITGGTRPGNGTNLFHSFGNFSVGTNNVARFLNDAGLATNNILSRVTGGHVSNIFGEINTANFPNANLYLVNPAGVVFGPTASLHVSGSVYVSTADYLRLADGLRFNAVPGPQDGILSQAPVVAFGFLNPHPRPITVQGATLDVQKHSPNEPAKSLSLVGGDIQLSGGILKAEAGINLVSVASQGEVRADAAPTVITPPTLGKITMSHALLDTAAPEPGSFRRSGPIVIRGGQLVMDQSTITASVSGASLAQFNSGEVTLQLTDTIRASESHIVSNGGGANRGIVSLEAGHAIRLITSTVESDNVLGDPGGPAGKVALKAPMITLDGSHVSATGHTTCCGASSGGSVTIQADRLDLKNGSELTAVGYQSSPNLPGGTVAINARDTVLIDHSSINASGLPGGNAGSISITAGDAVRLNHSEIMAEGNTISVPPFPGHGGNIVIDAGKTFVGQSSTVSARSKMFDGGNVNIHASERIRIDGGIVNTSAGGDGSSGEISLQAGNSVRLLNGAVLNADNTQNGHAGRIVLDAGENLVLDASRLTVEGSRGDAGRIEINAGNGVRLVNGTVVSANNLRQGTAGTIVLDAGDHVLVDASRITAEPIQGQPGQIHITAGEAVRVVNGSRLTVNNNGFGPAGILTIEAGTSVVGENSRFVAQTGEGHGGAIRITAPDRVRLTNSIVSTGVGGSSGSVGGTVQIASETVRVENGRIVSNASNGSGGTVTIKANDFRPDAASVVEALSLGGGGADGRVSIQPLP